MRSLFISSTILLWIGCLALGEQPAYAASSLDSVKDFVTACRGGDAGCMATIRSYLNKGGDPNAKYRNESGLAVALGRQNPEAARLLLATKGIKVNEWNTKLDVVSRTYSTLMNAVAYPDIVKILLERGVDLDRRESWSEPGESLRIGDTALLIAIGNHNSESVKLLIDHGATLNLTSGKGETALVRAISRATHGQGTDGLPQIVPENPDIVKLLLDKGANVEQLSKSADGHTAATPLGRAAALGNLETAKLLIHGGAKVQAPASAPASTS